MQTIQKQGIRNGVDVDCLMETMEAIRVTPSLAEFKFRSRNSWVTGGHNRSMISDFDGAGATHLRKRPFVLGADEPPVLLSADRAPNPVEYVLHALAACLTTALVYHAAARGVTIEEVHARLEGDLDIRGLLGMSDEVRNGYEEIRVTFDVKGDASPDVLEELVTVAQQRSPVFDIVSHGVPVSVRTAR